MNTGSPLLTISHLDKWFAKEQVLFDISMTLNTGEIGCLLGPSGCGKTTLLRTIAGFESIHTGTIHIDGSLVSTPERTTPPERRDIGMVFQDYALFPHLTAEENIAFGLGGIPAREKRRITGRMLELVGLDKECKTYPHELSGGQQQRVALARALAPEPKLLLMDEPFSNLDVTLREKLTVEVRDILKSSGITALMVTHNQFEAFSTADKVGVIFSGNLKQWDSAYNIYHNPASMEVATFVGDGATIAGRVTGPGKLQCGLGELTGNLSLPCDHGCSVDLLIRPEDVLHDDTSPVQARVVHKSFRGPNILYKLELESRETCLALVSSHHNHSIGEKIGIVPEVENLVVFPASATDSTTIRRAEPA